MPERITPIELIKDVEKQISERKLKKQSDKQILQLFDSIKEIVNLDKDLAKVVPALLKMIDDGQTVNYYEGKYTQKDPQTLLDEVKYLMEKIKGPNNREKYTLKNLHHIDDTDGDGGRSDAELLERQRFEAAVERKGDVESLTKKLESIDDNIGYVIDKMERQEEKDKSQKNNPLKVDKNMVGEKSEQRGVDKRGSQFASHVVVTDIGNGNRAIGIHNAAEQFSISIDRDGNYLGADQIGPEMSPAEALTGLQAMAGKLKELFPDKSDGEITKMLEGPWLLGLNMNDDPNERRYMKFDGQKLEVDKEHPANKLEKEKND